MVGIMEDDTADPESRLLNRFARETLDTDNFSLRDRLNFRKMYLLPLRLLMPSKSYVQKIRN